MPVLTGSLRTVGLIPRMTGLDGSRVLVPLLWLLFPRTPSLSLATLRALVDYNTSTPIQSRLGCERHVILLVPKDSLSR